MTAESRHPRRRAEAKAATYPLDGKTGFLARPSAPAYRAQQTTGLRDRTEIILFGLIGWPWLLKSLYGGSRHERAQLLSDLALSDNDLPPLGSWRADAAFLRLVADRILSARPGVVVEFGAGASTLVAARALRLAGHGRLISFDEHRDFVNSVREKLDALGLSAEVSAAPVTTVSPRWPGRWYDCGALPDRIDLLIVDGPHWTVHPFVRGAADALFPRLSVGGMVLLDDADRPGERVVARRWRKRWPNMDFQRLGIGSKGCLVGVRCR